MFTNNISIQLPSFLFQILEQKRRILELEHAIAGKNNDLENTKDEVCGGLLYTALLVVCGNEYANLQKNVSLL